MRLFQIWRDAVKKMELPQPSGKDLAGYLEAAGFVDVQIRENYGVNL